MANQNPLLSLQPNKVSRDVGSYVILLMSEPKAGKSSTAAQFPKTLFIASEPTQRAIPGIFIQDVTTWGEFKKVVRNLKDDEVKENFHTICLDTVDLLSDFCEKYICNREGVEKLADIPWGQGYNMVEKEFEQTIRSIIQMGYGMIMLSHTTTSTFTREDGSEYNKIIPAIGSKRCRAVCENLADIYATIKVKTDEDGNQHRVFVLRPKDDSVAGGNHFKYLPNECPLSYDALSKAVSDAIDKEEAEVGGNLVKEERNVLPKTPDYDFDALMDEFKNITRALQKNTSKEEFKSKWAPYIVSVTDEYLGKGKKVNDCTPQQVEQLSLIVDTLKEKVGEGI